MKSCVQPLESKGALAATITAIPESSRGSSSGPISSAATRGEGPAAIQIGLRRALTIGCGMWTSFFAIDLAVIRYMDAGSLRYFVTVRVAVMVFMLAVLFYLHRKVVQSELVLRICDVLAYTSAAIGIGLMCVEFRGLASPYIPGFCLVLLGRTVTAQDPWQRGIAMTALPVASFFAVLFGATLLSPRVAEQVHNPATVTTLLINSAYVLATSVLLIMCGHIVWSLRRQVFEARSLGRYRLKRRLATGGMGDVWVAYHPGLKRDVAVKILRPEMRERSQRALARFEREVHATAELMHPNTVRVFDYGTTEDGLWYYVMELLEGETLADHVMRLGPLSPARAIHIVGQAARALAEAHERGIVHRDVKPENLFLTSLGGEHDFVKVIDFGIAKVRSTDGAMTETGCVLGTPAYISPEVAVGQEADSRSDVYGLGGVLYFLLCGRPPFEAETSGALIFAHVHERPALPSSMLGRPIPPDVEAIVMRALEKERDKRFETAAELALALSSSSLAGSWTFHDATGVVRRSSRPPSSGVMETLPSFASLAPPAVPSEWNASLVDPASGEAVMDPPPMITPKSA